MSEAKNSSAAASSCAAMPTVTQFTGEQWKRKKIHMHAFQMRVKDEASVLVRSALDAAKKAYDADQWEAFVEVTGSEDHVLDAAISVAAGVLRASPYHFVVTAPKYVRSVEEDAELSNVTHTVERTFRGLKLEPSA